MPALLVAALAIVVPARAEAEIAEYAGACTFTLDVTLSPVADLSLTPTSMAFSAFGTCTVNELVTTGLLNGRAATTPFVGWTCAAGWARGTGSFLTGHPSMPSQFVEVLISTEAGTLQIAAYAIPVFEGVGEFVQAPATTTGCLNGQGQSSGQYTGVFAFQDPRVS